MALQIQDRVLETTTTTGTGDITLAGAVTGFQRFSAVCAVGDTCYYLIEEIDSTGIPTGNWETGYGTYSALNTLTRTTIKASSNSGSAVSLSGGTARVGISAIASSLDNRRLDFMWGSTNTASAGAFAFKGLRVISRQDIYVDAIITNLVAPTNGGTYVAYLCSMTSTTTINTVLATSATFTAPSTSRIDPQIFAIAPTLLSSGSAYSLLIGCTSSGGTAALSVPSTTTFLHYTNAPLQNDGFVTGTTAPTNGGTLSYGSTQDGYLAGVRYLYA